MTPGLTFTNTSTDVATINGYLFDLDGTLIDTAPDICPAFNFAMQKQGFPESSEALIRNWVGYGARVMIQHAFEHYTINAEAAIAEEMFSDFRKYYGAHLSVFSQPYPTVVETLQHLQSKNIPLAVVTNKATEFTTPLLQALNLKQYFKVVVCGDTLDHNKPSAEPALHACKIIATDPVNTLFVGDSITDVDCARAAGCPVACFRDGYNHGTPAEKLGADCVFDKFSQLLTFTE